MTEMMYLPLMWVVVLGTAVLTAVVTQALPYMPKWWNVFKNAIRRVFTRKEKDIVDVIIIAKLQDRIDELEEQVNNLAKNHYRRETNRKNNIRRDVREYLEELRK